MAGNKLIGQNYVTPDLVAKVTGQAKYAEDFRVDGMLFAKLLLSPYPHARVKNIDASKALAMPGVKGILTADELPAAADVVTDLGQRIAANTKGERALASEPVYQGEPVLALAAVDEVTASDAIEKIEITWEQLPFVVDPLVSLRPGGPNARLDGNVWGRPKPPTPGQPVTPPAIEVLKWTDAEFADYEQGKLPMGKTPDEWTVGDLDAGFKSAALVLDETFVTPNTSHQTLEPRTAMAYWQNGKLFIHCSTQSVVQTVGSVSRWLGIDQKDVVVISAYTGGGFGSKATGTHTAIIPALLT
jgi:xanthine dehydrogenase molybdenum-binding subunit